MEEKQEARKVRRKFTPEPKFEILKEILTLDVPKKRHRWPPASPRGIVRPELPDQKAA
jgi:hypothetical protein